MPDKEEEKKEEDQFRVREEKDAGAGEDVLFQNMACIYIYEERKITIKIRIQI